MKQKVSLLAYFVLMIFTLPAFAGWYEIKNYVGTIGSVSVHVSLQTFDDLERYTPTKGHVIGSYYYDAHRIPIALEGKRQLNGQMVLCEATAPHRSNEGPSVPKASAEHPVPCQITLNLTDDGATGQWNDGKKTLPISLRQVGSLDDTTNKAVRLLTGTVEIPMWYHTRNHLFVGVYQSSDDCPVSMLRLRVISISSGRVDKEIPLGCDAGMIMTNIYSNVSSGPTDRQITVGFQGGKMGTDEVVDIDQSVVNSKQ